MLVATGAPGVVNIRMSHQNNLFFDLLFELLSDYFKNTYSVILMFVLQHLYL